ncbi:MAG: ATP-dependent sacrificial sulfur transferase LarE [Methanoregulaceae archaeon]|nr:ATP-dependent sacrificial sulfur transferase LarE [Methanoregulaceae archaeon]
MEDSGSLSRINQKVQALRKIFSSYRSVLISYSGGVDSALLANIAHDVLGDRASCAILDSPVLPRRALIDAKNIAARIGIVCAVLPDPLLDCKEFSDNPPDRCYFCKKAGAALLRHHARLVGADALVDGLNISDCDQYRPGIRASDEEGIRHPFIDAGITKQEIRVIARKMGLPFWNKPSEACLSSRIAYSESITVPKLAMIEAAEDILKDFGLSQVRVRLHQELARIEIPVSELEILLPRRNEIVHAFRNLGFHYVTLDLEGFRSGSMDEVLSRDPR